MNFTSTTATILITIPDTGRTPLSDLVIGILMIVLSIVCGIAYSIILWTIYKDSELISMSSYQFMFMLGVFDVVQCLPHCISGFFTIFQSTFNPLFSRVMGAIVSPCYIAYSVMTVVLSLQRLVQLMSPRLDKKLFKGLGVKLWLGLGIAVCLIFVVIRLLPTSHLLYIPEWYSWDSDHKDPFARVIQKIAMYIELSTIGFSGVIYVFVVIILARKRKRFMSSANYTAEIKILIQAAVITVYSSLLNFLWHNYSLFLPETLVTYTVLNFMWILSSGIYPVIYFVLNRAIREGVAKQRSTVSRAVVSMVSKGDTKEKRYRQQSIRCVSQMSAVE